MPQLLMSALLFLASWQCFRIRCVLLPRLDTHPIAWGLLLMGVAILGLAVHIPTLGQPPAYGLRGMLVLTAILGIAVINFALARAQRSTAFRDADEIDGASGPGFSEADSNSLLDIEWAASQLLSLAFENIYRVNRNGILSEPFREIGFAAPRGLDETLRQVHDGTHADAELCQRWQNEWETTLKSGHGGEVKLTSLEADGPHNYDCRFLPDRDPNQQPRGVLALIKDVTHLRRSEREKQEAQARLQEVLRDMPGVVLQLCQDEDDRIVVGYVSPGIERYTGLCPERIQGRAPSEAFPISEVDRERCESSLKHLIHPTGANIWEEEFRLVRPDGQIRWVHALARPRQTLEGRTAWDGLLLDIHRRKITEEELDRERSRLQGVLRMMPSIILQVSYHRDSGDVRLLYVSEGLKELYGVDPDPPGPDLSWFWPIVHPEDLPAIQRWLESLQSHLEFDQIHYRIRWPDGQIRWMQAFARRRPGPYPQGLTVLDGMILDVTQLKVAEHRLEETQIRLQNIIDAVPGVTYRFVVDPEGTFKVTAISQDAVKVFGVEADRLLDDFCHFAEAVHPEDLPAVLNHVEDSHRTLGPMNKQFRIVHPDGQTRWVQCLSVPHQQQDGTVVWDGVTLDITPSKMMAYRLQAAEQRLQGIVDVVPGVIFELRFLDPPDATRPVVALNYISDGCQDLYGVSSSAFLEHPELWAELLSDDQRDAFDQAFLKAASDANPFSLTFSGQHLVTRQTRWYRCSAVAHHPEDGPILFQGVVIDVTEQVQAEMDLAQSHDLLEQRVRERTEELDRAYRSLREKNKRLHQLAESLPIGFWMARLGQPEHLYVSSSFERIWGRTVDWLQQGSGQFLSTIHPEDRERFRVWSEDTQAYREITYRIIRPDGEIRWIQDRAFINEDQTDHDASSVQHSDGGHGPRDRIVSGFAEDVTERTTTEQRLKRAQFVLHNAPEALLIFDEHGQMLDVNQAATTLLGRSRAELLQTNVEQIPGILPEETWEAAWAWLRTNRPTIMRSTLETDSGLIPVEVVAAHMQGQGWHHGCAFVRDIRSRVQLEQIAQRTQRLAAIGTLAAGLAHQINNPLGAITLHAQNVQLIAEGQDGLPSNRVDWRAETQQSLQAIVHDAQRAGRIIQSVMQFARPETSAPTPTNLTELVRQVTSLTAHYAMGRGVRLITEIPSDPVVAEVHSTDIELVLVNLVNNAIEACGHGGEVTMTVRATDADQALLIVRDTGSGIHPDAETRIYDPFFTTKIQQGAVGIGLSIANRIVDHHDGQIVHETRPGAGSTFTVQLPRRARALTRANPSQAASPTFLS